MTDATLIRPVLAGQRDALIRAEIHAGEHRAALEAAVIQAISDYKVSIDEASEASGLRPAEIRDLLAKSATVASNGHLL